jgi:transcriptional regulator with XRE-family HTH domain
MKEFRPAKKRIDVSVGESVRIIRELQGLSQNQLAELTGIPKTTISAIENDRVRLGVERAKVLARAPKCHPAAWYFPAGKARSSPRHSAGFEGEWRIVLGISGPAGSKLTA